MNDFLSSYLWGYRKGYNTQQAFSALTEKSKNNLSDKGFGGGAVLMDLFQVFDTLNHDLLVARHMVSIMMHWS